MRFLEAEYIRTRGMVVIEGLRAFGWGVKALNIVGKDIKSQLSSGVRALVNRKD